MSEIGLFENVSNSIVLCSQELLKNKIQKCNSLNFWHEITLHAVKVNHDIYKKKF